MILFLSVSRCSFCWLSNLAEFLAFHQHRSVVASMVFVRAKLHGHGNVEMDTARVSDMCVGHVRTRHSFMIKISVLHRVRVFQQLDLVLKV